MRIIDAPTPEQRLLLMTRAEALQVAQDLIKQLAGASDAGTQEYVVRGQDQNYRLGFMLDKGE